MSFLIFTLPRSRSAWLAHYLSSLNSRLSSEIGFREMPDRINCIHDAFAFMTEEQIRDHMEDDANGIADPVMALFPDAMREMFPNAACVQVLRNPMECIESMGQIVDAPITAIVIAMQKRLGHTLGNEFVVPFQKLDTDLELICKYIGAYYDKPRHDYFRNYNIQAHNIAERVKTADDTLIKRMIARQVEIEESRNRLT